MNVHYSQLIKAEHTNDSVREILDSPIDVLVGVDEEDVGAMEHLNIETVYDLATSRVFNLAREITMAADGDGDSPMGAYGFAPSDATTSGERQPIKELAVDDISSLPGVGEEFDDDVREAIALTTVRDFSLWPPFLAARAVLNSLTGDGEETEDDGIPDELVPVARQYATERVFYNKAYLDEVIDLEEIEDEEFRGFGNRILSRLIAEDRSTPELASLNDAPVDVSMTDADELGFTEPALGALLNFSHSWYPEGLSLGQLLHSMTLAPAESTKIAMIDWSRRESGQRDESVDQSERVRASMTQNRTANEVQNGVAIEIQGGESTVTAGARAEQGGVSAGGMLGAAFGFGVSDSTGSSRSSTYAVSKSSGRRDISAEMTQEIQNSTQQHASSARNRRASVVMETSEAESEEITTRTVTNYNHMHSLNMHYYEVVQMYRTAVQAEKAEPVLFVPFAPLQFDDEDTIRNYRSALLAAAPDAHSRDLIANAAGTVTVRSSFERSGLQQVTRDQVRRMLEDGIVADPKAGIWECPGDLTVDRVAFGPKNTNRVAKLHIYTEDGIRTLENDLDELGPFADLPSPIRLRDIERVEAELSNSRSPTDSGGSFADLFERFDDPNSRNYKHWRSVRVELIASESSSSSSHNIGQELLIGEQDGRVTLYDFSRPTDFAQLRSLLRENRLYYSQAIWNSLDAQTVAMLLSSHRLGDRRIVEYIDTTPLATHGNYVAFRLSLPDVSDEDADGDLMDEVGQISDPFLRYALSWWLDWKERNYDPTHVEEDLVPLPSGGVHGEAILGRANSAEKLDITRFWDWQESPIPIQAPDIAPVGTGSRTTPDDLTPGSFDAPIVNIQTPPSLPDPTGISAVLNAVTTSNLFRDMSGLDAAAALAGQGQLVSAQGAAHAASTASDNYRTAAETYVESMKIAASLAAAAMGIPVSAGGDGLSPKDSNSGWGATYNELNKHTNDRNSRGRGRANDAAGSGASSSSDSGGGNTPDDPATTALNSRANPFGAALEAANDFVERPMARPESTGQAAGSSDSESTRSQSTGSGIITSKIVSDDWGRGLFKEEVTNFDVLLYGFEVNESDLLERHTEILDEVVDVIDPPKGVISYMGELSKITNVVGRASQTGSEANNQDLSEARADVVVQYLRSRAPSISDSLEAEGLGSSSPIKDRPGEEEAANRSASFEFFLKHTYLGMYTAEEAREWLRRWLEGAKNMTDEPHQELLRKKAKGQYLLAMNYIDMVENGYRDPPYASPAWRLLLEDQGGQHKPADSRIITAYSTARKEAIAGLVAGFGLEGDTIGESESQAHLSRSRTDPYYRYTYGPVKKIVDGEERWVAVREYVEEANALEREIFGDVTDFVDEEWMSE